MKITTLGAIDIGSNAIRLMISNVDNSKPNPEIKKVAFLRVPIRLGEDTFTKGFIDKEKAQCLKHAMTGFGSIMKAYNVNEYIACATSAMREAKNNYELIEEIEKMTGIKLHVIPGSIEAKIVYGAGGLNAVVDTNKNYLYVDVGGGSTELVLYCNHEIVDSRSFQIGTVRFLEKRVKKEEIEEFKKWLKKTYRKYSPLGIIGSGGNINKIHKLLCKNPRTPISYTELQIFYETLRDMSYEERITNLNLNTYRADVIIPAMEIFLTTGKLCKVNEFFVPKVGIVDGLIHLLNDKISGSKTALQMFSQIKELK